MYEQFYVVVIEQQKWKEKGELENDVIFFMFSEETQEGILMK